MSKTNVIVFSRLSPEALHSVRNVAPDRLNVIDGWTEFQDDVLEGWPDGLQARTGGTAAEPRFSERARNAALATAEVALLGYPYPKRILDRMTSLRWAHLAGAGVSSLASSEWWESHITTTSSRGHTNADLIAETAIAAILSLTKGLDTAAVNSRAQAYTLPSFRPPRRVAGKTAAILGAGGIGREVARLAKANGMRTLGLTRSATEPRPDGDLDMLYGPSGLDTMLRQTDALVVAAMLTDETRGMLGAEQLAMLKDGAFLVNVARGEIVDEVALAAALTSGKLGGAYLDVWADDMSSPPIEALRNAPNVVFTPHISGRSEAPGASSLAFFCENLARFVAGEPLENVVDWSRGY